jgi:hypothetical protein
MIQNKWVHSAGEIQTEVDNYHFSKKRDLFKYVPLEIYSSDGASFKGFCVLSISRNKSKTVIKMLDSLFQDPKDRHMAVFLLLKYGARYLADRIEVPAEFATYFKNRRPLIRLLKRQTRLFMFYPKRVNSRLAFSRESIVLNYCDGDTAFT